ncbi:MAG: hypothetical protein EOL88_01595 [Bacteroidia bacterium]|nr:hypothetical protein [Bacteroidia bacterium]
MKRNFILAGILLIVVGIVAIVVMDILNSRIEVRSGNTLKYDVEAFKKVSPELIKYREMRQLLLDCVQPGGIDVYADVIWFSADQRIYAVDSVGKLIRKFNVNPGVVSLECTSNRLYVLYRNRFEVYSFAGELLSVSGVADKKSVFTALAVDDRRVFVADAGNKRIVHYGTDGHIKDSFSGVGPHGEAYGFIIPSPYFDLAMNAENELWVVNTGTHSLQHYTREGVMVHAYQHNHRGVEGFSGCCNPAFFTFLPDGRFVTSEKGNVRVKIYSAKGEFESVVAPPEKFFDNGHAPDVATLSTGIVVLLDYDRKMVRFFKPLEK